MTDYDRVPSELKQRDQWLVWNASNDTPRAPLTSPTDSYPASWSDPEEWLSFDEAKRRADMVDSAGIGFVNAKDNDDYARGLIGSIDIDGCISEDGGPKDWVPSLQPFFDHDGYQEISPSGEGYRIPIVGLETPDWWSDEHFSDDEHEGIEVLTNKFATYTGDKIKGSGDEPAEYGEWVDDWLREAYIALYDEDPLISEDGDDERLDDDDAPDYDGDEWLTEDVAEDALDAINADVTYSTWRDIGMALANHFGTAVGKRLFTNWSRGGSKWDSDAKKQAERIVNDASSYDYGAPTLVHHATNNGWDVGESLREHGESKRAVDRESSPDTNGEDTNDDTDGSPSEGNATPIERVDVGLNIRKTTRDGEVYYERLTNFWLEVDAILERDDGSVEYLLTVDPVAGEAYQVAVEPVVFNDKRQFESKVCGEGLSATFDGGNTDLNRLKEYVAQQDAPRRRGVEHIGLHDDEWVVPDGTLTADGWTDDPGNVFEAANTPLSNKCSLAPELGDDYDTDTVRSILRLLPQTRITERLLPAMGWFYAAATRPHIQQWEGEFNILAVTGDTGAGKTATLEMLWSCFGVDGDLLRADGTTFPKMRALATSNALPVVFDEYKPADMSSYAVDQFHSLLRTSTRGGIEEKGRPDGSVVGHHLLAPAVISGEQALRGTAEERRTLQTNFSRQASVGGTPESKAFARLTGGDINGDDVQGYDLTQHALAYYHWVLQRGETELRAVWQDARSEAAGHIDELDLNGLDDMRRQAIQTLIYGCRLYRRFARDMGLADDDIPVGSREIGRAVQYILDERTSTEHVSNLDRFLELAGRAAAAEYLERGEHFEIVREGEPDEELRIKLSLVYDQLRRYARDHDIQDADLLDSGNDYRSRISDAAEDEDSYVVGASKQTRGLNRCVAIASADAESTIDGFETSLFRPEEDAAEFDAEGEDEGDGTDLSALDPSVAGPVTFNALVTSVLEPAPWLQSEGILQDSSGVVRFIGRGDTDPSDGVEEGDRVEIRDAMVTTNEDGATVVELIDGLTEIEPISTAANQSGLEQAASTDGGEPVHQAIDDVIRATTAGETVTVAQVAGETGVDPDTVRQRLATLVSEQGWLAEVDDGFEVL